MPTKLEIQDAEILKARKDAEYAEAHPPTPPVLDPATLVEYVHVFSKSDVVELVTAALEGKAVQWRVEAQTESQRGAANQSMILTLRWGADQLEELAAAIRDLPDYEMRTRTLEEDEEAQAHEELEMEAIAEGVPLNERVNQDDPATYTPNARIAIDTATGTVAETSSPYVKASDAEGA